MEIKNKLEIISNNEKEYVEVPVELIKQTVELLKSKVDNWIPFKLRPLTDEEKKEHPEWIYIVDCPLPDDDEEILVSDGKYVWVDTYYNDGDSCHLDSNYELEDCAWMRLPKAWEKNIKEEG